MIKPDTCIKCEKAEPEWGSFLCKPCQDTLKVPAESSRPEQGKPVAKRTVRPYHKNRFGEFAR